MDNENIIKARIVKTPTVCFISDCLVGSGYNYEYYRSKIDKLYFDGELPTASFKKNWWMIKQFPTTIQRKMQGERINERFEIDDQDMISVKLPAVVTYDNKEFFTEDGFLYPNLYKYKYDLTPDIWKDVGIDWEIIIDVPDFKQPPKISFTGTHRNGYSDCQYEINNNSVKHQTLDEIIFPEVLLHEFPCKFTSQQVYDITRQYIIEHIDNRVAKITSNYDFCFEVKKIVPHNIPETITYSNLFARTKKERAQIHTTVQKFTEYSIFEMTTEARKYDRYTPIRGISANNETELNDKMNAWLTELMAEINKPICECPHCNGKGIMYEEDIKKISNNIEEKR